PAPGWLLVVRRARQRRTPTNRRFDQRGGSRAELLKSRRTRGCRRQRLYPIARPFLQARRRRHRHITNHFKNRFTFSARNASSGVGAASAKRKPVFEMVC